MAIPLLDMKAAWAKISASFNEGPLWKSIGKKPSHPYTNGRNPLTEQAQMVAGQVKGSPFTGQTYNNRKGK